MRTLAPTRVRQFRDFGYTSHPTLTCGCGARWTQVTLPAYATTRDLVYEIGLDETRALLETFGLGSSWAGPRSVLDEPLSYESRRVMVQLPLASARMGLSRNLLDPLMGTAKRITPYRR